MKLIKLLPAIVLGCTLIGCGGGGGGGGGSETKTPPTTLNTDLTFKEIWEVFDRYYPLMHRTKINWQQVYDENSIKITNATSNEELLEIIKPIINRVLKDGHVNVSFEDKELAFLPSINENTQEMISNNTDALINFLEGSESNDYLSFGTLKSDSAIGYIKSKGFEPISDNFEVEFEKFKQTVNKALISLQNTQGMIVDVRGNLGGQGHFAYYLAGRFLVDGPKEITRRRYKVTTGDTESSLSSWITEDFNGFEDGRVEGGLASGISAYFNTINPSGDFQYPNPVVLLTAKTTASAAEYFTVAMKSQPHVTSLGGITFGIFAPSDNFTLRSNSKWQVNVSTADVEVKYKNSPFHSFESIGLEPDQLIFPTADQVSQGRDTHIEAAVVHILK